MRSLPRWVPAAVVLVALGAFTAWATRGILGNPGFAFLLPAKGAQWIGAPRPTTIVARDRAAIGGLFLIQFRLDEPLAESTLYFMAFRSARVFLDGLEIHAEPETIESWKFERAVRFQAPIPAGNHTLLFACVNDMGPPLVRVRWPEAGVVSDPGWIATDPGGARAPVQLADRIEPPQLAYEFPTVRDSAKRLLPLLVTVAVAVLSVAGVLARRPGIAARLDAKCTPSRLRWALLASLAVLGVHNLAALGSLVGSDSAYHYQYVHYVADHWRLPPADYCIQCFQPPLYYVLAAVDHSLLRLFLDVSAADRWLRLISVASGLGLVEIAFRAAVRLFPYDRHAQRLTIALAAFLPVAITKAQVVGNEALAGFIGAAAAFALWDVTSRPPASVRAWRFALAGAVWGLAILSKVTAVILAAPFLLSLAWWARRWRRNCQKKVLHAAVYFGACAMVCGWYFVRTFNLYGSPIIGGWDPVIGFEWWQFPGYRTIAQYTSFGRALSEPVFSLVYGFWDGVYAGLWFDVENSGVSSRLQGPNWNFTFAMAALPWAIVPTMALAIGAARALWPARNPATENSDLPASRVFVLFVVGVYGAAILGHSLTLPYYNAIKASYGLAAAPYLCVLIVIGFEPMLRRPWGRAVVYAWLSVWVLLVARGYWAAGAG